MINHAEGKLSDIIGPAPLEAAEATQLREKFYNATIIERIDANSDLARFRIRPDNPIPAFEPGQYVALGIGNWERRLAGTQQEEVPEKVAQADSPRLLDFLPLVGCPWEDRSCRFTRPF